IHDADIHRLGQWWKRMQRGGYAYALVNSMHGASPERKFVKEVRRSWIWGILVPASAIALAPFTHGISLVALGRYPLTVVKTIASTRKRGFSNAHSLAWGLSCGASVFPEAVGNLKFQLARLQGQQHQIIEYKGSQPAIDAVQPTGR
ncbi:MAG: hypothetical protein F6K28_47535, partial [Microcoleus sp. SIO2G3]|nr:hypothetical protein [Microcoleus sp. SIO2G3]